MTSLAFTVATITKYSLDVVKSEVCHIARTYGWTIAIFVAIFSPGTLSEIKRIEGLLSQDDEALLAFRQSVKDECNMTAVAVRVQPHRIFERRVLPLTLVCSWQGSDYSTGWHQWARSSQPEHDTLDSSSISTLCRGVRLPLCLLLVRIAKKD